MTAGEARDRAGVIRGRIREAVRALSVPDTDWEGARVSLDWAATLAMELARDCMREDGERRQDVTVTIPPVRTFARIEADKAHALKPLEEAAEAFAAWQACANDCESPMCRECHNARRGLCGTYISLVDECCDVIQATCNLLAALGVDDLTEAMAACERRNRERGRYE